MELLSLHLQTQIELYLNYTISAKSSILIWKSYGLFQVKDIHDLTNDSDLDFV